LAFGIDLQNYRIGTLPNHPDTYYLVFRHPRREEWLYIADYATYEACLEVLYTLIQFLQSLNKKSEGLYLLEHILFRPDMQSEKFGFYILDDTGTPVLKSSRKYTFGNRQSIIQLLTSELLINENFSVEQRNDGNFEMQFQSKNSDLSLISLQSSPSVQETHALMERLYNFLSDKEVRIPFHQKVAMYLQNEQGFIIPEDFFGFRLSIILPNWTARFQDVEFRMMTEALIRENTPAYIYPDILWLDVLEMNHFELLYSDWLQEKRADYLSDSHRLEILNQQFLQFLLELHQKRVEKHKS
jgi:hypothetical protein